MKLREFLKESMIRKRVVRNGIFKIVKTSDRKGYKIVNGTEKMMSPDEVRKRKKSARKAARKRKSKQSQINNKRKRSMARRT